MPESWREEKGTRLPRREKEKGLFQIDLPVAGHPKLSLTGTQIDCALVDVCRPATTPT